MANILEELEQSIRSIPDDPPFAVAYLRYIVVFRNLTTPTAVSAYTTAREFSQYIHYRNKFHSKPTSADACRGMSIQLMEVSELAAVSEEMVIEYLNFLNTMARNKPTTIERKISVMNSFYQYLIEQQAELGILIQENPFRAIRVQARRQQAKVMSSAEVQKLLASIEGENAVRDKAMILLILSSGLRLGELASLDISDVDGSVLMVRGSHPRNMELNESCVNALEEYLREYREPIEDQLKDNALFVSQTKKKRLTHRRIQQTIEKRINAAGFTYKGYSVSTLRDTAIQMLLDTCESHEILMAIGYLGFRKAGSANRFSTRANPMAARMRNLTVREE